MLAAHWLAYIVAAPDAHERAHLLDASGHGYWLYLAAAGLGGGVLALAGFIRSRLHASAPATGGLRFATAALALFQVVTFSILEGAERVASGHDLLSTFAEPVVVIGIVLQLVVAACGGLLLRAVARVIELVKARTRPRRSVSQTFNPASSQRCPRPLVAAGGSTLRGPPVLVRL